ncbi:hypothetical protein ALC62_06155 [Cyphomyrmex costatus]|uniref:Uncharacterized protein n=1 Tax=Cyphomyrmex costatus TaxID=456900 RepID=A0A195CQZ0_9HYME|nr:hypothetical protein ALC62_06155 [Cyphomyrmex costatus]
MPRSSDRVARSHGVAGRVRDWADEGSTGAGKRNAQVSMQLIISRSHPSSLSIFLKQADCCMAAAATAGWPASREIRSSAKAINKFLKLIVSVSGTTKEEETGVSSVTEGTTVVLGAKTRTGSDPGGGIDLLAALQLHNTTRQGVTLVPGLVRLRPAYYLQESCFKISSLKNDKRQTALPLDGYACASHYTTLVMQRAINRYCERSV